MNPKPKYKSTKVLFTAVGIFASTFFGYLAMQEKGINKEVITGAVIAGITAVVMMYVKAESNIDQERAKSPMSSAETVTQVNVGDQKQGG